MHRIRKSFTFEAAHQLETAVTAACHRCVHGHSYTVELVVGSHSLGEHDMVIDFAEFSDFKARVMETWDHGVLFHENKRKAIQPLIDAGIFAKDKVHFLPKNPTAETMAEHLFRSLVAYLEGIRPALPFSQIPAELARKPIPVISAILVRVHETASGWAEYGV